MWPTTSHAASSCGSLRTGVRRSTATSSTTRAGVTSHRPFRGWSRRSGCDLEIPDPRLRRRLQLPAPGRLATEQEGLRILSLSADLEGAEVLVPGAVGSLRLRLPPELELVQVLGCDLPLSEPFEQVLPQRWWKVFPPDLRHQSPNVRRASSSLSCSCSTRSLDCVSRSASRRNRSR